MSEMILKVRKKFFFSAMSLAVGAMALSPIPSAIAHPAAEKQAVQNISDIRASLMRYHDSGQYQADFDKVVQKAEAYLKKQAPRSKRPAVVLDIDETILSQWPEMKANQFAYFRHGSCRYLPEGPCSEGGWMKKEGGKAFPSMRHFIEQAQKEGVAVFLVTGRSEKYKRHMIRNLHKENVKNWTGLYMRKLGDKRSAAAYKTPIRAKIESEGYHIIVNMGDQMTDLTGGYSEKAFLLPNPFYSVP